ncbi:hypothetical protein SANTM175S_04023 [Streptomyces antimycoticus]
MKLTRDDDGTFPGLDKAPFDVDAFLARPLVARLATEGPRVRPVWFLWEDHAFWVLTGPWALLEERLDRAPVFELVVDSCDLATGTVHQVIARGHGRVVDFDHGPGPPQAHPVPGRTGGAVGRPVQPATPAPPAPPPPLRPPPTQHPPPPPPAPILVPFAAKGLLGPRRVA